MKRFDDVVGEATAAALKLFSFGPVLQGFQLLYIHYSIVYIAILIVIMK